MYNVDSVFVSDTLTTAMRNTPAISILDVAIIAIIAIGAYVLSVWLIK